MEDVSTVSPDIEQNMETNMAEEQHMEDMPHEVLQEVSDTDKTGEFIGICKWFNNVYGYGFITIWDGPDKGKDCFCHHSGIKPLNSQYKTLKKGEYLSFDIINGEKGQQAVNVRGIGSGPLLCDQVQVRKHMPPVPGGVPAAMPPTSGANGGPPGWNTVPFKKRAPISAAGLKRKRVNPPE